MISETASNVTIKISSGRTWRRAAAEATGAATLAALISATASATSAASSATWARLRSGARSSSSSQGFSYIPGDRFDELVGIISSLLPHQRQQTRNLTV